MLITYYGYSSYGYGQQSDIFDGAFFNWQDEVFDVEVSSASSSQITLRNPLTGSSTVLTGSGLVASDTDANIRGTLSGIEFYDFFGNLVAEFSGLDWSLRAFIAALDTLYAGEEDDSALMALLGSSGPITVDASAAAHDNYLHIEGVGVPITYIGSDLSDKFASGAGDDTLRGGAGDDGFYPGAGDDLLFGGAGDDYIYGDDGADTIYGGPGDDYLQADGDDGSPDLIDPGTGNDTVDAWVERDGVDYPSLNAWIAAMTSDTNLLTISHADMVNSGYGLIFDVDGQNGGATVTKGGGNGSTRIDHVYDAIWMGGLALTGTASDDTFNIAVHDQGWVSLKGGRGNDVFNFAPSSGIAQLDYTSDNSGTAATQGLRLNLATGIVSNDGFGGTDTILAEVEADTNSFGQPDNYGPVILEIRATRRADVMQGGAGDERFITMGGNDTVDGGEGWDMLRYDLAEVSRAVTVDLAAGTASGSWGGTAFSQTVRNIEEVRGTDAFGDRISGALDNIESFYGGGGDDMLFGDGFDATYAMDEAATVYRLYQATLGRAPDTGGHDGWTEKLYTGEASLLQVTRGFVASQEFQNTYGTLGNAGFVNLLYQNVLGRDADAGGLAGWTAQLDGGMSRAQVVTGFAQSSEFVAATAAAARAFALDHSAASWSDDVYRLYQATLGREPDLGGFQGWTANLASGTSLLSAVSSFVASQEFQNTYGTLGDAEFIDQLYWNVLYRSAAEGERAAWVARIEGGLSRAEVVMGFSQSSEFAAETASRLDSWIGSWHHDRLNGGSGDNLLAGGLLADVFEFEQADGGTHTVLDLETWDYLSFEGFGYEDDEEALAHMSQSGADVLFSDQGVDITFTGTQLAQITTDMIYT